MHYEDSHQAWSSAKYKKIRKMLDLLKINPLKLDYLVEKEHSYLFNIHGVLSIELDLKEACFDPFLFALH